VAASGCHRPLTGIFKRQKICWRKIGFVGAELPNIEAPDLRLVGGARMI
jgi:hypothetical protein